MSQGTEALDTPATAVPSRRRLGFGRIRVGALVLPALAFLALFYLYPLLRLLWLSVNGSGLSLVHYVAFFTDEVYVKVLVRTLLMALSTTVFCLLLGYPIAYLLVRVRRSARNLIFILIIIPYLTSFLVRTYAWMILLNDRGIINGILLSLGIVDTPVKLLYNQIGVYIGMVHIMLPFMILPLYAVMEGIDQRLVRAAHSLGSGPFGAFRKVFLPLSLPGVRSGSLLVFLITLGFYITPALLGGLGDMMLVNLIDVQVERLGNWNFASAASVILLVVTLSGFLLVGRASGSADVFALEAAGSRSVSPHGKGGLAPVIRALFEAATGLRQAVLERLGLATLLRGLSARRRQRRLRAYAGRTRPVRPVGRVVLAVVAGLLVFFLVVPTLVVVPMSFSSANFVTFPPPGWSLRWYQEYFAAPGWLQATLLSFEVGLLTMTLATVLGTLAAFALVRGRFPCRRMSMGMIVSPVVVPPVVLGAGVYGLYVNLGLIGSLWGLVFAHTAGATVYVVVIVAATLSRFDVSLERAAMSMGAGPIRTFWKVTLPLIRPGIIAGAVFAFIHSFDELVIAKLISGYQTKTLPVRMFQNLRNEIDPTIAAISTLLLILPLIWLLLLEAARRRSRTSGGG